MQGLLLAAGLCLGIMYGDDSINDVTPEVGEVRCCQQSKLLLLLLLLGRLAARHSSGYTHSLEDGRTECCALPALCCGGCCCCCRLSSNLVCGFCERGKKGTG